MSDIALPTGAHAVLVVQPDDGIAVPLGRGLEKGGHLVERVATAEEAIVRLRAGAFSLAVVDVDLDPGRSTDPADPDDAPWTGLGLARRALSDSLAPAVLLLTSDRWDAAAAGFDHRVRIDHVIKPFTLGELVYRTNALLRSLEPQVPTPRSGDGVPVAGAGVAQVPQNVV